LEYIARKKNEQPGIRILCCHLDSTSKAVHENYSADEDVVMLIGPEGGFSANELDHMSKLNVQMTHLGPFRLRVETAAVAACTSIHLINEMKHKS
jgi:16S rRNA (uracil1498-N3)-methyltransferase